jgi:hypothetical protein
MHGWWWPGRQTVVVLPCLVLAVAWWAAQVPAVRPAVGLAGVLGAVTWLWLVVDALRHRLTLIVDFETTGNPLYRAWRSVLPDFRHPAADDWLLLGVWLGALALTALVAAVAAGGRPAGESDRSTEITRSMTRRRQSHAAT